MPVVTSVRMNASYAKVFACLGVPPGRVVELARPLIADSAAIPDPAVARRRWFHPVAFEVFERMKRLPAESSLIRPERIYISCTRVPRRGLLMAQEKGRLGYIFGEPVTRPEIGTAPRRRMENVRQATRAHFDLR